MGCGASHEPPTEEPLRDDDTHQYVVTGSGDNTARIWNVTTGACVRIIKGSWLPGWLKSCAFSPDGTQIVTASWDKTAKVWDASTGACVRTLKEHTSGVYSCAFSPDGTQIVTASSDKTAKVWDASTGKCVRTLKGHSGDVLSCAFSPDGTQIVTASSDKTAKVWDASTGACVRTLHGHTGWVGSCAFSPDGTQIVTASADKTAKVWDASTGKCVRTLEGHTPGWVNSCAFSPDGTQIVTASRDATAKVWDASTGKCVRTLKGHKYGVKSCAFSPDGTQIVTASADDTAKVWDASTGACVRTLEGHTDSVNSCAFRPSQANAPSPIVHAKSTPAATGTTTIRTVVPAFTDTATTTASSVSQAAARKEPSLEPISSSIAAASESIATDELNATSTFMRTATLGVAVAAKELASSLPYIAPLIKIAEAIYGHVARANACKASCQELATLVRALLTTIDSADVNKLKQHEAHFDKLRDVMERAERFVAKFSATGWLYRLVHSTRIAEDFQALDRELRTQMDVIGFAVAISPTSYRDETEELRAYVDRKGGLEVALATESGKTDVQNLLGIEAQVLTRELETLSLKVDTIGDSQARMETKIDEVSDLIFAIQKSMESSRGLKDVDIPSEKRDRLEELKAQLSDFTIAQSAVKLRNEIGSGGFGVVHHGLMKGSDVAVKVLHNHRLNRASIKGILKEAQILNQLRHPSIMAFYGAIVEPPMYAIVMQYLPNGSVSDRLTDDSLTISWDQRIQWSLNLAAGLEYLHSRNPSIVHGDVKAANMLLDANNKAVLIDFGLSLIKKQHASSTATTQNDMTIRWAAPECIEGEKKTSASDMYSFAITLYEMVSQEPEIKYPFPDMPDLAYMRFIAEGKRPPLPSASGCPSDFLALIEESWVHAPSGRLAAESARERLENLLD